MLDHWARDSAVRFRNLSVATRIAVISTVLGMSVVRTPALRAQEANGAEDANARISAIEQQIHQLEHELNRVRRDLAAAATANAPKPPPGFGYDLQPPVSPLVPPGLPGPFPPGSVGAQQAAAIGGKQGRFQVGGVFVTLGGFVEAAGICRSRNEVADIASDFNTGESRFSARQSRLSLLVTGNPDPETGLQAYFETDFQGDSPTANSNESDKLYTASAP